MAPEPSGACRVLESVTYLVGGAVLPVGSAVPVSVLAPLSPPVVFAGSPPVAGAAGSDGWQPIRKAARRPVRPTRISVFFIQFSPDQQKLLVWTLQHIIALIRAKNFYYFAPASIHLTTVSISSAERGSPFFGIFGCFRPSRYCTRRLSLPFPAS